MGRISPAMAEMYAQGNYSNVYGPFLERPASVFSDGAFAPSPPIQPTPVDQPYPGAQFPSPRRWQYRPSWNLPTPPGTEGLKLASFDQLRTISTKYSVARAAIELRIEEIRGLDWDITMTTEAAKAYRNDREANRFFGERKGKFVRFFRRPDPDFWNFDSFMAALLEEIFVFDALSIVFRPKYGASFGMGGRGLLGSDLDSLNLISGPTIRPLIDLHGGHPAPPAPAYQQYLYGVPRSDYMTIAMGTDIEEAGLQGAEVNAFSSDVMLYAPYWVTRETPYGFPPVERALLPIISGLQKQEFQLDYFTEGTIPAVYISPGDVGITPTQIGELQSALNSLAGDPAYHLKVIVLPPGSKVDPQRPVDLSDSFDYLVMNQVCMAFDVQPYELGIIPNVGGTPTGPSAAGIRFAGQENRDIKSRMSTRPLLKFLCDIFNYVIQDICGQRDMQFEFKGLVDDEDKQAITQLGVDQIQNGISSIDEVRERLDLPPWGLQETSEPIVMTQQGPVPFSMAPQLIQAALQGQQQGSSSSSKKKTTSKQPSVRRGTGGTKPNGSHPAPLAPSRASITPAHEAAAAQLQRPVRGSTGGTPSRSPVAGSRKRGEGRTPTQGRMRNKAAEAELDSLKRHLRKGRDIGSWEPQHINPSVLPMIQKAIGQGIPPGIAVDRAALFAAKAEGAQFPEQHKSAASELAEFPGWRHDLGLVGRYKELISQAFTDAEIRGQQIRKDAASGELFVSPPVLTGMISDASRDVFSGAMTPMWKSAWDLGYESARSLVTGNEPDFAADHSGAAFEAFLGTEGQHWLDKVSRTGLGNSSARSEMIARTEVARAMNAGAIQAYKDHGVTRKHLLAAPDDRECETCKAAENAGTIPLDAIYPGGEPPLHPMCRCVSAPAGMELTPPQAHLGKRYMTMDEARQAAREDENRLCWLLLRAEDEDGKTRFLLQQRSDGSWGMPGGKPHVGEAPWDAAVREVTEEIGDIPALTVAKTFHHVEDGAQVYLYLCDTEYFHPKMNGSTPEETLGAAWFRKKEIGDLDLSPKFRDDWEKGIRLKDNASKAAQNVRTENGEWLVLEHPQDSVNYPYPAPGGGAQVQLPRRSDGAPQNTRGGGGQAQGEMGATEPPRQGPQDRADERVAHVYPRGTDDEGYPKRRAKNKPAKRFPSSEDGQNPQGGIAGSPGMGAQSVPGGKIKGVRPIVGAPKPQLPHPETPRPESPETYDPAEAVQHQGEDGNVLYSKGGLVPSASWDTPPVWLDNSYVIPRALAERMQLKNVENLNDPNPVDAEHVYLQMAANFPPKAIEWVKRARWTGPVMVPWDRVDTDDIDKWAASHQPGKVKEFERQIAAHDGHVAPSILVQEPSTHKAFLVDGHHRALARRNLKQDVLAYLGNIDEADRQAAWETHSSQLHQGSDPANKAARRPSLSKDSVNYRHATGNRKCGNCVMFHPGGTCDLVMGHIKPGDTCDRWEAK
jgi:SPP1 gp7 family putative phage head morphogenesis protein